MKIATAVTENRIARVEVDGDVDAHTAPELGRALTDLLAEGDGRLLLDATRVTYISSAGLRVILLAHREARQREGDVRIFGLTAQVRRVFEIAGFDELLCIRETCQEAMEGW